jgi:hypothetical protein
MVGSPTETEGACPAATEGSRHHRCPGAPASGLHPGTDTGYDAGDLVAENGARCRQLTGQVEIAPTDPAPGDPEQGLAGPGHGGGDLGHLQPGALLGEDGGAHVVSFR